MSLVSFLARPLLASAFVVDGVDAVVHPDKHAEKIERVDPLLRRAGVPAGVTSNAKLLARVSGAVTAVSGLMLATGRSPRSAALTLAVLNVPLTLVNNPVWAADDGQQRKEYASGLVRGLSLGGGLLLAAADRGGRPSWGWRMENARAHRADLHQARTALRERYKGRYKA
ncbi:DoxX family protein [Georgenia sp. AZ-5]|uniref:DoxX family protein n=1 Tax=Georgenia sp. AZ-5 TaxID=3367526 RepID=UPI003754653C